jgi:hypothetical protein
MGAQHLPSERKYYLSNLPADTPIKQLASDLQGPLGL